MLLNKGAGARTPIALPTGTKSVRFFASQAATIDVDLRNNQETVHLKLGYDSAHAEPIPDGIHAIVVHRVDGGDNDVSVAVSR